eukprot:Nitzschia sp. Nitz4//scaffold28_size193895//29979//31588//NITZ4_001630-RA/size193895-augustus-gene-0.302-mRNA-1//-1//CDS//3329545877//7270//frame0
MVKGNDDRGRRLRRNSKLAVGFITVLSVYVLITTIYRTHFAGMFVPDIEIDESGRARIRRKPHLHKQRLDPNKVTTQEDAVLEGFLTLIDVKIGPGTLTPATFDTISTTEETNVPEYHGAQATFCIVDWKLQKEPNHVPMFRDLTHKSTMCEATTLTVDLFHMARRAKEFDAQLYQQHAAKQSGTSTLDVHTVAPTGVVFHESRCGSTLVANLLAGFDPSHSRVFSESNAHRTALTACQFIPEDRPSCQEALHHQLIRDVFYLSGRVNRKETPQHVFYKMSSIATLSIQDFAAAMPRTPWAYLYRDSVEVMQSHFLDKSTGKTKTSGKGAVCLRQQPVQPQPATTLEVVKSSGREMDELSNEEYCAAHLASLSLSALHEHKRSGKGRFINYNQLPDAVWDKLLAVDYGIHVDDTQMERMKQISQVYSKDRGATHGEFEPDGSNKQESASATVVAAARAFTEDVVERMELLSKTGH